MNLFDERALLARAQKSVAGFGELFDAYYDRIYAYAYRRVGTRDHAEDIAASVFEDALRGIKRYQWQGKPLSAWLYRIASRRIADFYREAGKHGDVEIGSLDALSDGPVAGLELAEEQGQVHRALSCLGASDREIIRLVFFEELDRSEVAALLNCTVNNVYVRLYRALQRLEKTLTDEVSDGSNDNE